MVWFSRSSKTYEAPPTTAAYQGPMAMPPGQEHAGQPSAPGMMGGYQVVGGPGDANLAGLYQFHQQAPAHPGYAPPAPVVPAGAHAPGQPGAPGPTAVAHVYTQDMADATVRDAMRNAPERPWTLRHWFDTVFRGGQHYMLNFGIGNTIGTVGGVMGHSVAGPVGAVVAGALTKTSEQGLANARVGAVPNQNPGRGPIKWLRDKGTEEPALWLGFASMYALQEHFDVLVGIDPSTHPWLTLGTKLTFGAMAGIITATGAQWLRGRKGAEMTIVPPEQRKSNYLQAWKDLFKGNPLKNAHLLTFMGRAFSLVPFAILLHKGFFDGKMEIFGKVFNPKLPEIPGVLENAHLFSAEHGFQHGLMVTLGLLAFYFFRSDWSNLFIKMGAKIDDFRQRVFGRGGGEGGPQGPEDDMGPEDSGFAPQPTVGTPGDVPRAVGPHHSVTQAAPTELPLAPVISPDAQWQPARPMVPPN